MKAAKWFYFAVPVLLGVGVLLGSQPSEKRLPPLGTIDFTDDSIYKGDRLTTEEIAIIQRAIDSIRTPPPTSISHFDSTGTIVTDLCSHIADRLQMMLNSGAMEAETLFEGNAVTLCDNVPGLGWDQMNVKRKFLADVRGNPNAQLRYLEETLVHEHRHILHASDGTVAREQREAFGAEKAYKDSLIAMGQMDPWDSEYDFCREEYVKNMMNHLFGLLDEKLRSSQKIYLGGDKHFLSELTPTRRAPTTLSPMHLATQVGTGIHSAPHGHRI